MEFAGRGELETARREGALVAPAVSAVFDDRMWRVIYFDFNKSSVRPEFRDLISAHAAYMASNGTSRVTLEGHADERGTREYNLGLGERRGNAVSGLLSAQGGRGNQLSVVSYGEERPVCRVSDENCWGQNRRVEIVYTTR